ncbi:MAG: hypothetical protein M3N08_05860 [Pseudomonadota bacterium]|nr:hypothetical protein [Pseudomonadota bacterium]
MPGSGSPRKISLFAHLLRMPVLATAAVIIIAALWITVAAVREDLVFAQGTGQVIELITTAREIAVNDKNFATQPGEDILARLIRAKRIAGDPDMSPAMIMNPWKGTVASISPSPSLMRIESEVPARICRRLALFVVKNGGDLGLAAVETRADDTKIWQRPYDRAAGTQVISSSDRIEAACGQAQRINLALVLTLR